MPWSIWWGINRSSELPLPYGTLCLSVSNWYKVQIISLCLSWQIDGFAAVVGRNIIDGRGKAGRLRRATTPSGRPRKAALQLRLVPLPISMFVSDPPQGRGRRGGREEKLQGRRLLIWRQVGRSAHKDTPLFWISTWKDWSGHECSLAMSLTGVEQCFAYFHLGCWHGWGYLPEKGVEVEEEDEPVEELKKGRGRKKDAKPKQYNDVSSDFLCFLPFFINMIA